LTLAITGFGQSSSEKTICFAAAVLSMNLLG